MKKETLSDVALIILNYNTSLLTINTIRFLLDSDSDVQLVIVDNCSIDDSRNKLSKEFSNVENVHLIFNDFNKGYANGNNIGIKYAKSLNNIKIIGVMNPDVTVDISVVRKMKRILLNRQDIGLITAKTYYNGVLRSPNECAWKTPGIHNIMLMSTIVGFFVKKILNFMGKKDNFQGSYDDDYYEQEEIVKVDVVQGCFFMSRLTTLDAVHYLDDKTFLYYEENILAKKIKDINKINAVLTTDGIYHNHIEKDCRLVKRKNKIFDMACMNASRDYYILNYSSFNCIKIYLIRFILCIDFYIRKIVVFFLFKD